MDDLPSTKARKLTNIVCLKNLDKEGKIESWAVLRYDMPL